jgi:hypothetical protein
MSLVLGRAANLKANLPQGDRLSMVVSRKVQRVAGRMRQHLPGLVVPSYARIDGKLLKIWSGRRGSNPRRPAWEHA